MAIQEVRRVSHDLRPIQLDDLGLESALYSVANDFSERTGVTTDVRIQLPEQRLPDDIEITLYRITQEALTNIEKHAGADHVGLRIWLKDRFIWLEITDDGRGFMPGKQEPGLGLMNMRERAELISGHFEMRSKPGSGTRIRAGFSVV
jgi:two-component system NarL family sensor kinase